MKLLVFAHTPPPYHGQSYMVRLMLAGFGGDHRKHRKPADSALVPGGPQGIECYHVNTRVSKSLEDIGDLRLGKFVLLLGYCAQAIWCRFRYGVENFYYIPAPGKPSALYRDWLVLLICRPFFKRLILHWHAAGLAKWLETSVQIRSRAITFRMLRDADLSIVLSHFNQSDADKLFPRNVKFIPNGIPDPCPHYEADVLPHRRARFAARMKALAGESPAPADAESPPHVFNVLFLGHCMRQKGLFDTLDGVNLANQRLQDSGSPMRMHLTVAGEFVDAAERAEFDQRLKEAGARATYVGFVTGEAKQRALTESDCLCFPSYYYAESFGLVLVEAMAFGLPVVTTRWRSIPELFAPDYAGLVDIRSPDQVAQALLRMMAAESGEAFRSIFLNNFTLERHLANLATAIRSVEGEPSIATGANGDPYLRICSLTAPASRIG